MIASTPVPTFSKGEDQRKNFKPLGVGSLQAHQDKITGTLGIPMDVLPPILQMLIARQFKFMVMRGTKFRYRSAGLHSFSLEMKLTEDDCRWC
jgi:hypothetical protein